MFGVAAPVILRLAVLVAPTRSQGIGDLTRMYAKARADGVVFRLAAIRADFNPPRPAPFDNGYMKALFALGEKLGCEGYPWAGDPPEVAVGSAR